MSLIFRRTSRRIEVIDRIFDKENVFDTNSNDIIEYKLSSYLEEFWPSMVQDEINGNYISSEEKKRTIVLSNRLDEHERAAILRFMGNNALLACGVCRVLQAIDGQWTPLFKGWLCFIRDYDHRVFKLSLVDADCGHVAEERWSTTTSPRLEMKKINNKLLTFESESDGETYGLNFAVEDEAEELFNAFEQRRLNVLRRRDSKNPKRRAPPPPSVQAGLLSTAQEIVPTEMGVKIELPIEKKEKEKKGILSFFNKTDKKDKKEKKNKKKLDKMAISQPEGFKHINHLETVPEDQDQLVEFLRSKLKVDPNDPQHMEILRRAAAEHADRIRSSMRVKKRPQSLGTAEERRPVTEYHPPPNERLTETRSSLRVSKNTSGRNRPRDVKKADQVRLHRRESSSSNTPPRSDSPDGIQSTSSVPEPFDPLKPNWDAESVIPAAAPPALPVVPPPERSVSRRGYFKRQDTPPNPATMPGACLGAPKLPARGESYRRTTNNVSYGSAPPPPIPRHQHSHVPRREPSPPPSIPRSQPEIEIRPPPPSSHSKPPRPRSPSPEIPSPPSSAPPAPPPPPPDLMSSVLPPVAPPSNIPAAPPPPPPSTLNLPPPPSFVPSISPDRRSFLEEIQNVDKKKLLHSVDSSPNAGKSPTKFEEMGLLESIQRELDSRRTYIAGSSDDDSSSSEDDDDSWSD